MSAVLYDAPTGDPLGTSLRPEDLMDGHRFDALARSVAHLRTRRGLLRAVGLALGAGAVGAIALDDGTDAAETCRPGGVLCRKASECCSGACMPDATGRGRCACEAGTTPCGPLACCGAGQRCVNGVCRSPIPTCTPACGSGQTCCGTTCTDTGNDPRNCGACGNDCDDGNPCTDDFCETGQCVHVEKTCNDNIDCTEDVCDPLTGECVHTPIHELCPFAEEPCFVPRCDPLRGCVTEPKNCDDGNPCNIDACDEIFGTCNHFPNNTICSDGLVCTTDTCIPNQDGVTFSCQHVFDARTCGFNPAADCASFACGVGNDCVLVFDDTKCTGGLACERGVCTTTGCTYVNNCRSTDCTPVCANCTCSAVPGSPTGRCVGTCGV